MNATLEPLLQELAIARIDHEHKRSVSFLALEFWPVFVLETVGDYSVNKT